MGTRDYLLFENPELSFGKQKKENNDKKSIHLGSIDDVLK